MVGFSASSRSSVAPASVALEHTSVDPATKVASSPNANPPIQKNGELQNSLSVGGQPADRVEVLLVSEQGGMGVHHALGAAGGARRVDDGQRIRPVDVVFHRLQQLRVDGVGESVHRLVSRSATWRNCGAAATKQPVESKSGARKNLGQPLHVVVRAERRGGQAGFRRRCRPVARAVRGRWRRWRTGSPPRRFAPPPAWRRRTRCRWGRAVPRGCPCRRRVRSARGPAPPTGGRPRRS